MILTRCLSIVLLAISLFGFAAIHFFPSLGIKTGSLSNTHVEHSSENTRDGVM